MNVTGNDRGCLATLQKSATGRKLLEEAAKRGVKIEFKADNGDSTMGQYNPNNNTITVESGNMEKMVETLGHELLHATTNENGNSMQEEKMAFVIGEQIAEEAGVNNVKHDEAFWGNHVNNAYKGLQNDNGIMNAMNALGVAADEATAAANKANNYAANNAAVAPQLAAATPAVPTAPTNPFGATATNNADPTNLMNNIQGVQAFMQQFMQMIMMIMQMLQNMFQNNQQNPNNLLNQQDTNQLKPVQGINFAA